MTESHGHGVIDLGGASGNREPAKRLPKCTFGLGDWQAFYQRLATDKRQADRTVRRQG